MFSATERQPRRKWHYIRATTRTASPGGPGLRFPIEFTPRIRILAARPSIISLLASGSPSQALAK